MKYSLTCQNIELTAMDQQMLEEKLDRLQKHLQPPWHARVVLRADTHHRSGEIITCTLTVTQHGTILHAERQGASVQDALDAAVGALKRELERHRDKHQEKR